MKVLRLRTDGASRGNPGPAGLGAVIEDDQGMKLRAIHRYLGTATNNQAEYRALIMGLEAVKDWNPDRLEVFMDSTLVVEQVSGRWKVKDVLIQPLVRRVHELLAHFPAWTIQYVPREQNKSADWLSNQAIDEYEKATLGKIQSGSRRPGGRRAFTRRSEESPGSKQQGAAGGRGDPPP